MKRIRIFEIDALALLDSGSQTTIIPLQLLEKAVKLKVNLHNYIERIPGAAVKVRDASGNEMEFLETILLHGRREYSSVCWPWRRRSRNCGHVDRRVDEVVILGTNALELFKLWLQKIDKSTHFRKIDEPKRLELNKNAVARVKHSFRPSGWHTELDSHMCSGNDNESSPMVSTSVYVRWGMRTV